MNTSRPRRPFTPFGEELEKIFNDIGITSADDFARRAGISQLFLSRAMFDVEMRPARHTVYEIIKTLHDISRERADLFPLRQANALLLSTYASPLDERQDAELVSMLRKPVKVLLSYSREDDSFREEIEKHLKILERQDKITVWCDREILILAVFITPREKRKQPSVAKEQEQLLDKH